MRELKFRQPIFLNDEFSKWRYWGCLSKDVFVGPHSVSIESYQYTGRKDKNHKSIYEGDIVRNYWWCKHKKCGNPPIYETVFMKGSFCYKGNDSNYGYVSNKYNPIELTKPSNWEVIGNIHENPELLGE